ncbi:hypothetical protein SDJN02_24131, partial [Cucurbita argyrosperma subsp. argyrosperma]
MLIFANKALSSQSNTQKNLNELQSKIPPKPRIQKLPIRKAVVIYEVDSSLFRPRLGLRAKYHVILHELLKENEEEKEEAADDLVSESDDNDNAAEDLFDIDMVGGDETENEEMETVTTSTMTRIKLPMKTTKTWFITSVISSDDDIGQRAENKTSSFASLEDYKHLMNKNGVHKKQVY